MVEDVKRREQSKSTAQLVSRLASETANKRIAARRALAERGYRGVPELIAALADSRDLVRFEAAKVLGELHDPRTIPALLIVLSDSRAGVRWLAAEALGRQGGEALVGLLEAIVERCCESAFCEGAHHALHDIAASRQESDTATTSLATVLEALDSLDASVRAPVAAAQALEEIRRTAAG